MSEGAYLLSVYGSDCNDKYKIILKGKVNRDVKVRKSCDVNYCHYIFVKQVTRFEQFFLLI